MEVLAILCGICAGTIVFGCSFKDLKRENITLKNEIKRLNEELSLAHDEFLEFINQSDDAKESESNN